MRERIILFVSVGGLYTADLQGRCITMVETGANVKKI